MDGVFSLIDGIDIKGTHNLGSDAWLAIDDANHFIASCGSGVRFEILKTGKCTTIIIFSTTDVLTSSTIPYPKEYLLQLIDGITFNATMHVAPFTHLLGAFNVVVGYIHTTCISYTTIDDYNLAVVATIDVVYPRKAYGAVFHDVDTIFAQRFEMVLLQWLVVRVVAETIEHGANLHTLFTLLSQ